MTGGYNHDRPAMKWAGPLGGRPCHHSRSADQDLACLTRSGENGTRRMRTPVASKIALAIAAAIGRIDGSPAPDGAISGWSISTVSIFSGLSVMSRIG